MKNLKTFEESKFSTVKSSEIGDSWSVDAIHNREKEKSLTGKKDLDLKLGAKVIELLSEYGLFPSVGSGKWLHHWKLVLDSEKNFKEYRVELGEKKSFKDWLDYEEIDYNNMDDDEQYRIEVQYDNLEPEKDHRGLEFSVFLPVGTKNLEESAMSDASKYLYTLSNSLPEVYKDKLEYSGTLSGNPVGFKKFLSDKELKITNQNIEDVPMIETRLYKDNKFFYHLEDTIGKHEMSELIERWLKLIK